MVHKKYQECAKEHICLSLHCLLILKSHIIFQESNKYADARLRVDHKRAVHILDKLEYYAAKTQFKPEDAE